MDAIAILDYGSQFSQLIARRVREMHVYCELFPWDTPAEKLNELNPKGFILSGSPASVYDFDAPQVPAYVLKSGLPLLGICYGMQILARSLGGRVACAASSEYGSTKINVSVLNPILTDDTQTVWMSHGDRIEQLPDGFISLATSENSPIAAMADLKRNYFGLQFHPEVQHTQNGKEILRRFVQTICSISPEWYPAAIIERSLTQIRAEVGNQNVISAVSGGVDSAVATALVHLAVGKQLTAFFIDNGLLREGEAEQVKTSLHPILGDRLISVNAQEVFLNSLKGITNPESKRQIIGNEFIQTFHHEAQKLGKSSFLVQGTIYPDVIESAASDRSKAHRIKTHHNVGGLPANMPFRLVEPLRFLFKDEVREIGEKLGLPKNIVWRQPFPGPGLAVRCLGEVTPDRLKKIRKADQILREELALAGMLKYQKHEERISGTAQAFAVLLPIQTVGVMGDQRSYAEVIAIRAVTTDDFMTADWARLPHDLLSRVSARIVNEVIGINRVVYDITSKPPATIEWE